jgi:ribosome-associated translation inhibitor RaiA
VDFHIKFTNLEPDERTKDYIREKVGSLGKLLEGVESESKDLGPVVHAWVEVAKTTRHHKEGQIWYAECQLKMPRKSLRAESTRETLEAAIEEVKDDLGLILKKEKDKRETQLRRQRQ